MKRMLMLVGVVSLFAYSCSGPGASDLKKQNDSLYMASVEKDRQMNELIGALVEIDDNLQQIKEKENVIALNAQKSDNMSSANLKEQINNDIKAIYELMLQNKEKIEQLEKKIKLEGRNNDALKKLVARLNRQLEQKSEEITQLKKELKKKDIEISNLNFTISGLQHVLDSIHSEVQAADRKLAETTEELYKGYYVFGTKKELKEQKIITSDGLFSKKKVLEGDFDKDYFTRIDIREVDSIPLFRPKAKLLTPHPADSYTLEKNQEGSLMLKITDKEKFWSTSRYLVVQVN
jgi:hemin uptake protein HemP